MRSRWFVGAVLLLLLPSGPAAAQAQHGVDVGDDSFTPAAVSVAPGDTVAWTQSGTNPHTVTADDGSFDSHPQCPPDCMGQGDTYTQTFADPGEVGYHCKIHGSPGQGMAGVVSVQAPEEPSPAPAPEEQDEDDGDDGDAPAATAEDDDPARDDEAVADAAPPLAATGPGWGVLAPLGLALLAMGGFATGLARRREQ